MRGSAARLDKRLDMTNMQSKPLERDYSDLLASIFEVMLRGGIRAKELLPVCVRAVERAETRSHSSLESSEYGGLMTAALVLDAWHRDRRYLTVRGAPKSIRLLGRAPSVEALIRRQKIRKHVVDIAYRLKAVQLIVPCGRALFKPASDIAVISARDPFILQHTIRALSALVGTVTQNMSGTKSSAPLIERCAEVPDLPRKHIKAFQTFTQAQGRTFLRTINDWLESRRARTLSEKQSTRTVRAGIHTYAYFAAKEPRRSSLDALLR